MRSRWSLKSDPNVVVIGAHSFLSDRGLKPEDERALWDAFPDRLIDPPTSEGVTTSLVTGAAMAGHAAVPQLRHRDLRLRGVQPDHERGRQCARDVRAGSCARR